MHEAKLGKHVHFSVSVTTINKKWLQGLFSITTSSLLKLENHTMHGGESVYFSVSMMPINKKWPWALFEGTFSLLITCSTIDMNFVSMYRDVDANGNVAASGSHTA